MECGGPAPYLFAAFGEPGAAALPDPSRVGSGFVAAPSVSRAAEVWLELATGTPGLAGGTSAIEILEAYLELLRSVYLSGLAAEVLTVNVGTRDAFFFLG